MTAGRILVVEDHGAVRAGLVAYLDAHDELEVVGEAENGREACELAARLDPDLVLMDVQMPVMGGIEATRALKAQAARPRILLISAYEQAELVQAGEEAGADGFLMKGASGDELVARVRELVT